MGYKYLRLNAFAQRISEIIKRKNKQRLAKAAAIAKKEAAGDFSHLKNKKGVLIAQPLPQPTLPNVRLDDDDDASSMRTRVPAPSTFTAHSDQYFAAGKEYGLDYPQADYPPMPAYNQPYAHHGDPYNNQFNPSVGTLPDEQPYDDNDYGSTANLTLGAAPIAYPERGNAVTPRPQYGYAQQQQQQQDPYAYTTNADPHAAYRGPSPVGHGYTADAAYDHTQQYGRQPASTGAQYQQHQQNGYGYPSQHDQQTSGGNEGYNYGGGQAHAM